MTYEEILKIKELNKVYYQKIVEEHRKSGIDVLVKFSCYLDEIADNYLHGPRRGYFYHTPITRLNDIKEFHDFYIDNARSTPGWVRRWELMEILLSVAIEETGFDIFVPELYSLISNDCLMTTDLKVTLMKLSKTHIDNERFNL